MLAFAGLGHNSRHLGDGNVCRYFGTARFCNLCESAISTSQSCCWRQGETAMTEDNLFAPAERASDTCSGIYVLFWH
jgi:hypothetical protein